MAHPPQASASSSGRHPASLVRAGTALASHDELHTDEPHPDELGAGQPRTRTSDGRSSEQRSTEEQAFERAAAQLRPAWATGQARQHVGVRVGGAPISDTASSPKVAGVAAEDAEDEWPTPASLVSALPVSALPVAVSEALPGSTSAPVARDAPAAQPPLAHAQLGSTSAANAQGDEPRSPAAPDSLQHAAQVALPEHPLDDQPIFAAAHSNFPPQPFGVGVTPSTNYGRRSSTDETGDFSFVPRRRSLNVRLLAIGAAATLALAGVWALASGGSDEGAAATARSATAAVSDPVAPPASAPAPAAVAPAQLPAGRELPKALAPTQPRDIAPAGTSRGPLAKSTPSKAPAKAPARAVRPTPKAAVKAPVKPTAKVAASVKSPANAKSAGSLKSAPAAKSAPVVKSAKPTAQAKPQAKPGKRVRLSTDVLDPWDK